MTNVADANDTTNTTATSNWLPIGAREPMRVISVAKGIGLEAWLRLRPVIVADRMAGNGRYEVCCPTAVCVVQIGATPKE